MEHLTKQQIVLLTLLVSFVTSLSTGIVTVSLMDQAPAGVTRTINQVIEKTIQQAAPQNASVGTVSINVQDQLASATALVASSTVKIKSVTTGNVVGLGLILSKNGSMITDKSIIDQNQSYSAILADGTVIPLTIHTITDSSVFFMPILVYSNNPPIIYYPIQISSSYSLGQKVYSLNGTSSPILSDGLITQISTSSISTSISSVHTTIGSPLFDVQGNGIGIQGSSTVGQNNDELYPLAPLTSLSQ